MVVDVYVPVEGNGNFSLTAGVEGVQKHEAPPVRLKSGWNTVRTLVNSSWLPAADQAAVRGLGWSLACGNTNSLRSSVVFDNFQVERVGAGPELLEGWERPLFWRVADESVMAETTTELATEDKRGLKLHFDFTQCSRPVLLARLNPPWDLSAAGALKADVYVPDECAGPVSVALGLRAKETEFAASPMALKRGWNKVKVTMDGRWLPKEARAAAEQVEWTVSSASKAMRGWIVFDNLRAEDK